MQIDLIGCGDAYDGARTNAALLVREAGFSLLIDCGPTVPAALFRRQLAHEALDALYLTHNHPDHILGVTTLLNWMASQRRHRPLTLICQPAQRARLQQLVEHAHWPEPSLPFALHWCLVEHELTLGPWQWRFYPTHHAVANHSVALTGSSGRLFYSGDGVLSAAGAAAAAQADMLFLECEYLAKHPSHGSWHDCQKLMRKADSLGVLYHLDPACRAELSSRLADGEQDGQALWLLAEDNQQWRLPLQQTGASTCPE